MKRIVLATRNGHKVREVQQILADLIAELDLEIVGMGEFPDVPDVVETGVTFAQNATLKAVAAAQATGLPALADAIETGRRSGAIGKNAQPLKGSVAAVSVGVVKGVPVLDLDYPEDSTADTDMNVVLTGTGAFVEIQGTAETEPFDREELNALLDLAATGCAELTKRQMAALSAVTGVTA